ncbi:MAG: hypothetical protein HYZ22_13110 [Chloroflexi bacterium]|nr:hypothetical protein [Chloroflexota bacterium]
MDQELKLKDYPILSWIFGFVGIGWGGYAIVTTLPALNFNALIAAGVGLLFLLFSYALTATVDKQTGMLTLDYRSILLHSVKEIPLNEIQTIRVDSSTTRSSKGGRSTNYRVEAILKSGDVVPFRSYHSSNFFKHQKWANQLRAFLNLGEALDETPMGIFRAAQQVGAQASQTQQEAMTGSNAEMRNTNGVNWQLQSFGMGATPGTRWYSPDFKTQSGFLFLAQKATGQSSTGFLASLGATLFKQSISLYGFGASDAPNIQTAQTYASLSPALDAHFMAFTSNQAEARQILNPWTQQPLSDWGAKYPLQQFQSGGRFSQIVVLFGPKGVHIATQGTLTPDKLDELTRLGVDLVKAQGA